MKAEAGFCLGAGGQDKSQNTREGHGRMSKPYPRSQKFLVIGEFCVCFPSDTWELCTVFLAGDGLSPRGQPAHTVNIHERSPPTAPGRLRELFR